MDDDHNDDVDEKWTSSLRIRKNSSEIRGDAGSRGDIDRGVTNFIAVH